MSTHLYVLALASLVALSPLRAEAQSGARQAADAPTLRELQFSWPRDSIITGTGAVLWITSEIFVKEALEDTPCRWCDRTPDGRDTLNALDRWGRGIGADTPEGRKRASRWSDIMGFGVVPVGILGTQALLARGSGAPSHFYAQDAVIVLESAMVAAVVNQAVKFTLGRERPFVHVLPEEEKRLTEHRSDNNMSFYSGHTSLAFSLVTSAGMVSQLRGYENAWVIWAVGLPAAASVGLLRMGADKHYLTDVLVGALAGSVFGITVPLLLHQRVGPVTTAQDPRTRDMSMRVSGGLGSVTISGSF